MPHILILGLPKSTSQKVDSFAKSVGLMVHRVYADIAKNGLFGLLPKPEFCIKEISNYLDQNSVGSADYRDLHILVLPYASIPQECIVDLKVAEEMGAQVSYVDPSSDATWPGHSRRKPANHEFYTTVSNNISAYLQSIIPAIQESLTEFINRIAAEYETFFLAEKSIDDCEKVAPHRQAFIRKAVDALANVAKHGLNTRFDDHCRELGLHHAQTGGAKFTLTFSGSKGPAEAITCQTHLKQGDKTSREAAARVYYHLLDIESTRYAILLYAGPHPDSDQKCRVTLE